MGNQNWHISTFIYWYTSFPFWYCSGWWQIARCKGVSREPSQTISDSPLVLWGFLLTEINHIFPTHTFCPPRYQQIPLTCSSVFPSFPQTLSQKCVCDFLVIPFSCPECKVKLWSLMPAPWLLLYSGRNCNGNTTFSSLYSQALETAVSLHQCWDWVDELSPFLSDVCPRLPWDLICLLGGLVISHY